MSEPKDNAEPSAASGGSDSYVPAWADDLGREIACYLWGISALRHGLTMPGDFIPCVSAALRAGFASGQIRLPRKYPASTPQVEAEHAGSAAAPPSAASGGYARIMENTNHFDLSLLGFSICGDGLYRRTHCHDSLAVQADGYRITLYAESDDQSVRIQIASLPTDGDRLTQIIRAIG